MGIEKIGTTIGKKIIAWTKTGKSLLETRTVKVNMTGLKLAPVLVFKYLNRLVNIKFQNIYTI